jgi:DNA-directed RNA polymerase specialized sigma24 family protein
MRIDNPEIQQKLISFAEKIARGNHDIAVEGYQRYWERVLIPRSQKEGRSLDTENYNLSFLKNGIKNSVIDVYRSSVKPKKIPLQKPPYFLNEPILYQENYLWNLLEDTADAEEKTLLQLKYGERLKFDDIAARMGISPEAARKRVSRLLKRYGGLTVAEWYRRKDFRNLNRYRLTETECETAVTFLGDTSGLRNIIREGLSCIDQSRTFQNTLGILKGAVKLGWLSLQSALRDITSVYKDGPHCRGNATYITDSLLDLMGEGEIYWDYLRLIDSFPPRKTADTRPISSRTLFDIKPFRLIDPAKLPPRLLNTLQEMYDRRDDPDLRRTLALQLLRFQNDPRVVVFLFERLPYETDQINAYYLAKYIRHFGMKQKDFLNHRPLFSRGIKAARAKWPGNRYFRDLDHLITP